VARVIEVSLLGPPRVERDGVLLAFDTRKALALLAHLALTDRPRPRDALADLLWPATDPEHARGALRRTLSTLRAVVGAERIEATRDHVLLVRGPDLVVDVDRFRALRAGGDLEGAAAAYTGDLLEGFAVRDAPDFEDWLREQAEALDRELTSTLAGLAAALEAAGDAAGALQVVRRWLAADPLHEPAHRALIRLYALTGDRAAALSQYRDCVRTLSRELGVPPLPETTALYDAVNRGSFDPTPTATRPPDPAEPAPGQPPFVGRADELRSLVARYAGIGDDGCIAVVAGEPGIGKTRMTEELAAEVVARGGRALVLRAHEDEMQLAYAPVVEALRGRARAGGSWLDGVAPAALDQAARLVPELAEGRSTPAEPAHLDGPGAEFRFLGGLWDVVVAAAAGAAPGLVVVDDVQWADDATLALLGHGIRRLRGRRVLVLLTWRTPFEHVFARAAADAARTGGGSVCRLERLDRDAVRRLVLAVHPEATTHGLSSRLWERTEGVPLLLVEYLRTLDPDAEELTLPEGVRDVLRARLEPLSPTARQVLSAAAVTGRSFAVDTVRVVGGRTDEETVSALEELVRRGLVREGVDDYDFSHEQLRSLVYDDTSLARRRLLHARAADVPRAPIGAVARHLHLAGRDAEAAAAHWRAAEQARAVYANAEAVDHLVRAAALGYPDRMAALTAIGDLRTIMGDYQGALVSLEEAAAGAGPADLGPVEHRLGRLHHRRGQWALAEAHLQAALAAVPEGDAATRAGITADLSLTAHATGDVRRARALAQEAAELAEIAGDDRARCHTHNLLGVLATSDGDLDTAAAELTESLALAERTGDPDLKVAALNNLALARRAQGDLDAATDLTREALVLCVGLGDRHREGALHNNLADLMHAQGRSAEAMEHLKAAVEIFAEVGGRDEPQPEIWKLVRW
jgi:DNA-binding SARP family transcriptional activator